MCTDDKMILTINSRSQNVKLPIHVQTISSPVNFEGRELELKYIANSFDSGAKMVILWGMGGIGKTELATQYVKNCKYWCPQIITFKDDEEVNIDNFISKVAYSQEIYDKLINVGVVSPNSVSGVLKNSLSQLNENLLLFIDNANKVENSFIENLLQFIKCKIILTTRKQVGISDNLSDKVKDYDIKELEKIVAAKIFENDYGKLDVEECKLFEDVVYDDYLGNTQAIVMIAKMLREQGVTLKEYNDKKEMLLKEGKFTITIHGESKFDTVANNLCQFLKITDFVSPSLDNLYSKTLAVLMLMEQCGIEEQNVKEKFVLNTSNEIIELANRGLINRKKGDNGQYVLTMHPMVVKALQLYGIEPDEEIMYFVKEYAKTVLEDMELDNIQKLLNRLAVFEPSDKKSKKESDNLKGENVSADKIDKKYYGTPNEDYDILDVLLDEDNKLPITLVDQNGRRLIFEQIAVIPYDEKIYCVLKPVDKIDNVAEDEAIVFYVDEKEGEAPVLMVCTDEKTAREVFKEYYRLLLDI